MSTATWVIAGQKSNTPPIVGKLYELHHSRKGTLKVQVDAVNNEWVTCTIVDGVAKAVMSYDVKYEGDELTVRNTLSSWIPLEEKP